MRDDRRVTRVLVVDDEETAGKILTRVLEKHGYACAFAASAAEARLALKGRRFDLLLSDVIMPGESGIDLIRHARSEYPDMAIVMVTAVDDPHEARIALEIGVYGYIIKPFEPNQVLITISNAMRRQELERKERSYREDLERAIEERTGMLRKANDALKKREERLREYAQELQETNTALQVILRKREEDQKTMEERVLMNVKSLVEPYLEKLKGGHVSAKQQTYLHFLESALKDIVSPFAKELSSTHFNLTPAEIHIADLIKHGKRIKEIASLLNLSENTVMSHRYSLRTKLGLKNKKMNLRTYLLSLK